MDALVLLFIFRVSASIPNNHHRRPERKWPSDLLPGNNPIFINSYIGSRYALKFHVVAFSSYCVVFVCVYIFSTFLTNRITQRNNSARRLTYRRRLNNIRTVTAYLSLAISLGPNGEPPTRVAETRFTRFAVVRVRLQLQRTARIRNFGGRTDNNYSVRPSPSYTAWSLSSRTILFDTIYNKSEYPYYIYIRISFAEIPRA